MTPNFKKVAHRIQMYKTIIMLIVCCSITGQNSHVDNYFTAMYGIDYRWADSQEIYYAEKFLCFYYTKLTTGASFTHNGPKNHHYINFQESYIQKVVSLHH